KNTLTYASDLLGRHPDRQDILRMITEDTRGDTIVVTQMPKREWLASTHDLLPEASWRYEFADDLSPMPACRPLPAAMLVAVDDGETVRLMARDGRVDFDVLELLGFPHELINDRVPNAPHTPRITI